MRCYIYISDIFQQFFLPGFLSLHITLSCTLTRFQAPQGACIGVTRSPAGDLSLSSMVLHPLGEQSCRAPICWRSAGKLMREPPRLKEVIDQL